MNRKIIKITVFLLFTFPVAVSVDAADWPCWRGPNGDGISTETDWNPAAFAKEPKILWKFNVGPSASNIAIKGKYLYTSGYDMDGNDAVYCLNAETGK